MRTVAPLRTVPALASKF
ncbi:hypothetical protein AZE42_14040 [Rhizopogon vesiculosus]|uniref:Uncharacterized protein n=1 Tax=Rhizopogon vesiculosus TaxID=180088 RepID=A0A1J8QXK0_9AGAM|nr:hypothetical protein AZE42_14040 [Rhizopogon vesiculosus]